MAQFRVGIIGCGRPWKSQGASGFGMANFHANGYTASPDTTIVALADINLDNARAFQAEHGGERIYTDYQEMLAQEQLDIVSICTWPHHHAPMVIAAAEAGVKAIHCEKPMAPSYAEALQMVDDLPGPRDATDHQPPATLRSALPRGTRHAQGRLHRATPAAGRHLQQSLRLGHALVRYIRLL